VNTGFWLLVLHQQPANLESRQHKTGAMQLGCTAWCTRLYNDDDVELCSLQIQGPLDKHGSPRLIEITALNQATDWAEDGPKRRRPLGWFCEMTCIVQLLVPGWRSDQSDSRLSCSRRSLCCWRVLCFENFARQGLDWLGVLLIVVIHYRWIYRLNAPGTSGDPPAFADASHTTGLIMGGLASIAAG
jgi:hypothetical protein